MRYDDWGARSPRWMGIRSEFVETPATRVHVLRADALPGVPDDAPTQVLVHGIAGSAWHWLDVIGALRAHGPVLAVDLLGCGGTVPLDGQRVDPGSNAQLLHDLADALGLARVVVHGMSMGGLVSVLYADLDPARIERLVLVAPALLRPMAQLEATVWQTLGKFGLGTVPRLARTLLRLAVRQPGAPVARHAMRLTDTAPERWSEEMVSVRREDQAATPDQPWRLETVIGCWESLLTLMFVDQQPVVDSLERIDVPTLLVWGDLDQLVERPMIDHVVDRRPDWSLRVLDMIGHSPPQEAPHRYSTVVGDWLAGRPSVA